MEVLKVANGDEQLANTPDLKIRLVATNIGA